MIDEICQCCTKRFSPSQEPPCFSKIQHKIHITPADIPRITISQHYDPLQMEQDIEHVSYRLPGNKSFRAIRDYSAQDADEVSFSKGDLIINCRSIDKDWMTGFVQRTRMCGMLPANSVRSLRVNL
ncbi:LIM and SH3 domain protein 1 [Tetranychus urticae]|uniref:SH3 domain-containing protein n=1 Tax=Tetranychus urticae TaxID=32264 RepID=T1L1Y8_TETUR|nr:LIM and SH3 domain protein 1 [Tetranychus urticae]